MATTVRFDDNSWLDIGERSPDRWLLIRESIRALIELLGRTEGKPPGARQVPSDVGTRFVLEEVNWKVTYIRTEARRRGTRSVVVTIDAIQLKFGAS